MSYYPQDSGSPYRRALVFMVILAFHLLVIRSFWAGMISSGARPVPTSLQIDLLPRARPPEPLSLPAVSWKESFMIEVADPEVHVDVTDDLSPPIQGMPVREPAPRSPETPTPTPPAPAPRPTVQPRPIYVPGGMDRYPPESRRAHETGAPTIMICISATGTVDDVQVSRSSGFPRLDQAAVGIGREARFRPARLDGKPVPVCAPYRITFSFRGS
jgi:periplasmic protein TonB